MKPFVWHSVSIIGSALLASLGAPFYVAILPVVIFTAVGLVKGTKVRVSDFFRRRGQQ